MYCNRVLTLLVYLNDVERGGHTVFPCIGAGGGPPADPSLCETFVHAYEQGERRKCTSNPPVVVIYF